MPVIEELKRIQKQIDRTEAWEQRGQFKGIRTWHNANRAIPAATYTHVFQSREVYDFGAPFSAGMHQTSVAAFTGTVTTVIGATTIAGVGTLFTTELYPGAIILVNTAEYNVVTEVISNTSAVVNFAWQVAAAGVAFRRVNEAFVIPGSGVYGCGINMELSAVGYCGFLKNQLVEPIAYPNTYFLSYSGASLFPAVHTEDLFAKYDILLPWVYIAAGGNTISRMPNSPACFISRIS